MAPLITIISSPLIIPAHTHTHQQERKTEGKQSVRNDKSFRRRRNWKRKEEDLMKTKKERKITQKRFKK
jgi:hypothetical protein